jgi:subtilisin family serine protease
VNTISGTSMACPHVGEYQPCLNAIGHRMLSCLHVSDLAVCRDLYTLEKRITAGIAALFWDQQPNATTQELWNQISVTASSGTVKNALGPRDAVATTLGTFNTEPATKNSLKVCPIQPLPLAPTPAPPSSSGSGVEPKYLRLLVLGANKAYTKHVKRQARRPMLRKRCNPNHYCSSRRPILF